MADLDKIYIRDLFLRCILGINDEEREKKQDVLINVCMEADLSVACASDDIKDTVDYKKIKLEILSCVENSRCFLIERLAELIAQICLAYEKVQRVTISIDKPGALRFAKSSAVEIIRQRD